MLIVAIASTILAALLLAGAGVYWATDASDEVSVERQARSARHAMEMSVDELAHQQEKVDVWDLAAAALAAPRPETLWIHDNIGTWLNTVFAHDKCSCSMAVIVRSTRRPPAGRSR
jgi:sensor domain CHASE-containing protein